MSEADPPMPAPQSKPEYKNHPISELHVFLNRSPMPDEGDIGIAAEVLSEGTRDDLGRCLDLSSRVHKPTVVLSEMFAVSHPGLPERWKSEPEIARTVLSMSSYIEIGILQATALHMQGQGEERPELAEQIHSLTEFAAELQAK